MAEKLALKRLAGSDLSFFDLHFRNKTYGDHRQKGINLNTDVFVDQFYPQAHSMIGARWPVLVTIFGPGTAPAYAPPGDHRRPITYNNAKNWRLDGGTIPDDPALPDRFQPLAPGDLVLLRFRGDPAPTEVDVVLIATATDNPIHAALNPLVPLGRRTMIPITVAQIEAALSGSSLPAGHPLTDLEPDSIVEAAIEDVALGGTAAAVLIKRRGGRRLTPAEMANAREQAQRIGADGEVILNGWLEAQQADGSILDLDWASQRDAAAPYDFKFRIAEGKPVKMDAKSTTGSFDRTIHISAAEMIEAADDKSRYDIARVHSIDEDGARLRIAQDIGAFARTVMGALALPAGVRIDGFSIAPSALTWGDEVAIPRPADDEED
jgi:hypothetical protein